MSQPNSEYSAGELMRGLELIRGDIREVRADIMIRPSWQDVSRVEEGLLKDIANEAGIRKAAQAAVEEDLASLRAWNKYAVNTAVGLLVTVLAAWLVSLIV